MKWPDQSPDMNPFGIFGSYKMKELRKRIQETSKNYGIRGELLPGAWGAPNKRNADGAEGIFGNAGRVWAAALRLDPP